jgi:hypothetical protein
MVQPPTEAGQDGGLVRLRGGEELGELLVHALHERVGPGGDLLRHLLSTTGVGAKRHVVRRLRVAAQVAHICKDKGLRPGRSHFFGFKGWNRAVSQGLEPGGFQALWVTLDSTAVQPLHLGGLCLLRLDRLLGHGGLNLAERRAGGGAGGAGHVVEVQVTRGLLDVGGTSCVLKAAKA